MESADVLVLGCGGMGTAACYELARRGVSVIGIERFAIGHDRGSSHGETRIIRTAYFEHPDYVPLLRSSFEAWAALGDRIGETLVHANGLLLGGPSDSPILAGVRRAAEEHDLAFEHLDASAVHERFPVFRMPGDHEAIFEPGGGYLEVEHCVQTYARVAREEGARIMEGEVALRLSAVGDGAELETDRGRYRAGRAIVTAGAWSAGLFPDLFDGTRGPRLQVLRKTLYWHAAPSDHRPEDGMPCFFFDTPQGCFYGFPAVGPSGVKAGNHSGGDPIEDPTGVRREVGEDEGADVGAFVSDYLPRVKPERTRAAVCMYTMTPDEHFVLDRHPEHPAIVVAAGFSGHGFKFAPVMGEILADLALEGHTGHPIGFLKWRAS